MLGELDLLKYALTSAMHCGLRDLAALVAVARQLVRSRQARGITAGDRGGTVGSSPGSG